MHSVAEFVGAALKSDPSLSGTNDKDRAAIERLQSETETMSKDFPTLDETLTPLTYLHSNSPTTADISLYCHAYPSMMNTATSQHPNHPALLRYFLHIQSLPPVQSALSSLPNSFPPLSVDVSTLPIPPRQAVVVPAKLKKEKKPAQAEGSVASVAAEVSAAAAAVSIGAASAASTVVNAVAGSGDDKTDAKKGQKKEKPAKAVAHKEEPSGPMPSMIDMRVGKVLDVKKHPDAESLYVEQIDVGEPEPRTVCSGLVKYMSEDEIRGATIIVICNLKPVAMRGVKSYAMLLCASSKDGKEEGGVEFVLPPTGSQAGERVYFEGEKYESLQPETQLNPKKKVFETIQPGFITLANLDAAWVDPETQSTHRIRTKDGICKAKSFVGASLS
ncbi:MAG: G4 quadruplex nucleic acid binding protein [Tremellales sp. Tagirdzhanova-0007]|nr:MAG: G4 quadruplex nucleic acid binding protein [Tremellales sp. Tagirdzhanova-0007]